MFSKNTQILDDNGNLLEIFYTQANMNISGWNFNTHTTDIIKIKSLIVEVVPKYIQITIGNTVINCHPHSTFYTEDGWAAWDNTTAEKLLAANNLHVKHLTEDSKLLNINNEYVKIDEIKEINETKSLLGLDTDDRYDTFIVENYVVHNMPSMAVVNYTVNYIANTVYFSVPFTSLTSFNWWFNLNDGTTAEPPIAVTTTESGFSYPAFSYTAQTAKHITNASYNALGQI